MTNDADYIPFSFFLFKFGPRQSSLFGLHKFVQIVQRAIDGVDKLRTL